MQPCGDVFSSLSQNVATRMEHIAGACGIFQVNGTLQWHYIVIIFFLFFSLLCCMLWSYVTVVPTLSSFCALLSSAKAIQPFVANRGSRTHISFKASHLSHGLGFFLYHHHLPVTVFSAVFHCPYCVYALPISLGSQLFWHCKLSFK